MSHTEHSAIAPAPLPIVYRNLISIALLATIYRMNDEAHILDQAVEGVIADGLQYGLYRAVALGMAGRTGEVKETLGKRVEDNPEDDAAKVAYAVSLLFGGDPQWRRWIDNVLATSVDQNVRKAALGVLAFMGSLGASH